VLGGSVGDVSNYLLVQAQLHAALEKYMESLAFSKPSPLVLDAITAACAKGCPEAVSGLLGPTNALEAVPLYGTDGVFGVIDIRKLPRVAVGITTQALVTAFMKDKRQDLLQFAARPAIQNEDKPLFDWVLDITLKSWSRHQLCVPILTAIEERWMHPLQEILAIEGPPWQEHQLQEALEAAAGFGFLPAAKLLLAAVHGWSKGGLAAAMGLSRRAELVQLLLESAEDDWEGWELLEALKSAISFERVEVVERILEAMYHRWQPQELAEAAAQALMYEGKQVLSLLHCLIDAADELWEPEHLGEMLAEAACHGQLAAVKSLLAAVPIGDWGHQQLSKALRRAVRREQRLVLKELLLAKSFAHEGPWRPAHLAEAVMEACKVDRVDILHQLLESAPHEWDPSELAGAVVEAVLQGSSAVLGKLLEPRHISKSVNQWGSHELQQAIRAAINAERHDLLSQLLNAAVLGGNCNPVHLKEAMLQALRGGHSAAFWVLLGTKGVCGFNLRTCWKGSHGAQCLMHVLLEVVKAHHHCMLERLLNACTSLWLADQLEPALVAAVKRRSFQSAQLIIAALVKRKWSPVNLAAAVRQAVLADDLPLLQLLLETVPADNAKTHGSLSSPRGYQLYPYTMQNKEVRKVWQPSHLQDSVLAAVEGWREGDSLEVLQCLLAAVLGAWGGSHLSTALAKAVEWGK
jgi:hypothetical protein